MKRIVTILVCTWLFGLSAYSQNGWVWQSPLPQGNDLLNVHIIDGNTGFAVGRHGTLLKTTDGGGNWILQPAIEIETGWDDPPTELVTDDLRCITFVTRDIGWIVGMGSLILKTTDGGNTWVAQETPFVFDPNNPFAFPDIYHSYYVHFADVNTGWAVGHRNYEENFEFKSAGSILRTTDGGETWVDQPSGTEHWLFQVWSMDANTAWVVGGDWNAAVLLKTTDGGTTWNREDTPRQRALNSIYFLDPNTGWIAGIDFVFKTTDGGESWTSLDVATFGSLRSIAFTDANNGWIAGTKNIELGGLWKTTDGGVNWIEDDAGYVYDLNSICFTEGGTGWIVGDYGTILKTNGDGSQWNAQSSPRKEDVSSACFVDNNTGWAVGGNYSLQKTMDGGRNWTVYYYGIDGTGFTSVTFIDENTGWATADKYEGPFLNGIILKTTDGGTSWMQQTSILRQTPQSITFLNSTNGWIVGEGGLVQMTSDGGDNWINQDNPFSGTTQRLESVHFVDENKGWIAAGHEGKILHTTDGGTNWIEQVSGTTEWLYSIFFIDENVGWTAGSDGVYKTTDGGTNWFAQDLPNWWYNFESIRFADANVGYAVGGNDILKTTDGGENWVEQQGITDNALNCVFLVNANKAWVVGAGGTILNWTTPNAPPTIINLTDFSFMNTETHTIDLDSCVTDPDHTPGEMTWQVTPSDTSVKVAFSNHHVSFSAFHWGGEIDVQFKVTDPDGASDTLTVKVTVTWPASVHDQKELIPQTFCLRQNYPNPFNPSTTVVFGLPKPSKVGVTIYNLKGEKVEELFEGRKSAGYHSLTWIATDHSTGTYIIRMKAGNFIQVKKCVLIK